MKQEVLLMVGYISYTPENKGWEVARRRLVGTAFLEARLGQSRRLTERFCAARAARAMARAGVRSAVFPTGFPHQDLFLRRGILPVDTLPLYRRMAPLIVKRRMGQLGLSPGTTTVAVVAERMTEELRETVTELALQVRYVMLALETPAEDFCDMLKREYGISVLQQPTKRQLRQADVLLLLRPWEEEGTNSLVLYLYDGQRVLWRNGVTFALPRRLMGEVEENCCLPQLLTVLCAGGILQNYQIPIIDVDITGKSYYNADIVNHGGNNIK